ncbi:MAG: ferredoxin III, nif-specific [Polaromonas sp.]
MSNTFTLTMPSGAAWTPRFISALDQEKCIGCGRCFKVCSRGVLELVGLNADGEYIRVDEDDDEDDEYEKKVMTIAHQALCIGCTACAKICPKKCYTHAPAQI